MKVTAWLSATERVLDVIRIALDEAQKARLQERESPPDSPKPKPPDKNDVAPGSRPMTPASLLEYPPRFGLFRAGDTGEVLGIGRRDWDAQQEFYKEMRLLEHQEAVRELNACVDELNRYKHYKDF